MTKIKSVEEAVKMVEVCAIKEYEATENGGYKTNNKYARYEAKCIKYLYEHNKLCTLHEYLKHEHSRVRLSAAYALLPLFENECVKVLNEIANGNYGFSGISAKMILMQWYDGELKFPYQTDRDQKSSLEKVEKPSVEVNKEEHVKSENFSPETLRLSRLFECTPTGDNDLHNEQAGLYVSLEPAKQEIEIRVNTFVNPYTQEVETVYQERLERFKSFEHVATIEANEPSKLGFMQIVLTIPYNRATDDVLTHIKEMIYAIFNEWKPNESLVWFKVEYRRSICYFEGEWWMPTRAVIKSRRGYERYDFSDETKYDEEMWEIVKGEYDEFEDFDSFALIDGQEFQDKWDATELNYKPKPY